MTGPRKYFALATGFLAIAAIVGVLWALGILAPGASAAPTAQRGGKNPCAASVTKTLQADTIRLCEQSQVTVGVWPECPGTPVHIVFIIDEQYKIGFSDPRDRTEALRNAVQRLELDEHPNILAAVVWMQGGHAQKKVDLTNSAQRIISQLDIPVVSRFEAAPQCFKCGYREAVRIFDAGAKANPDVDIYEITILAPLGVYSAGAAPGLLQGANMVKARRAKSITTCFAWTHCVNELRQAASEPRLYLGYGEGKRLAALLHDVIRQSVETFLRTVALTDDYPESVKVITDSVSPAAVIDPQARTLSWSFEQPIGQAYTVTYRVEPLELGSWPMGEGSSVVLTDSHFREAALPVPAPILSVPIECPRANTPTPVPSPTFTNTPTPTPTDTPVPPTPTPTPVPQPIYLPVAIKELCVASRTYSDVVLVLDMSTSMLSLTGDGRRKLEAVQEAAQLFLDGLVLTADGPTGTDQVAVVGFNRHAWIQQRLTSDKLALRAAIAALPVGMQEFTRLDLAFERGAEAMRDQRHGPNLPVMILLTDGLPNQVPYAEDGRMETTVLRQAAAAKAAGIRIYTIGVGRSDGPRPDVNRALLEAAATGPGMYYSAPDAGQLAAIYSELPRVIPCGGARYWPEH